MIGNIPMEAIITAASFILLSITQVILIIMGKGKQACDIEKKKEKLINKLTAKRNKYIDKAEKENKKIMEVEKNESSSIKE